MATDGTRHGAGTPLRAPSQEAPVLRSLYTGISGMRSMQTMMDVTGNNIANVNTTGYKSANTVFEDTLSETLSNGSAPQGAKSGTNPAQVGLGVRVAGITTNWTQGATQTTGRNSDMLIAGDGFFVVNNNGVVQYTRSGAFTPDANGTLSTLAGSKVQGWMAAGDGSVNTAGVLTAVTVPTSKVMPAYATHVVTMSGRLDNTVAVAGTTVVVSDVTNATQTFQTELVDRNGVAVPVTVTAAPAGTAAISTTGVVSSWTITISQGATTLGAATYTPASGTPWAAGTGTITTDGKLTLTGTRGADGTDFDSTTTTPPVPEPTFDLSGLVVANRADEGVSNIRVAAQDGYSAGGLTSWKVEADGAVIGTFDNGRSMQLAKIAVATFDNPAGLDKQGGSTYIATSNSGLPNVGPAGDGARGSIVAGALEMSNVDLAAEFTNLIVSQRGFQANSRVITTSDSMLDELVNLKR